VNTQTHATMVKKSTGLALASIFAVLLLCGQACAQRRLLADPSDDGSDSAFDNFVAIREGLSSSLGFNLDQIGDIVISAYSDGLEFVFQLLPESGNFTDSDVTRIRSTLENSDIGTLTDLSYDDDAPGVIDATFSTSDDLDAYDDFQEFRQNAASVLGINLDQVGDITGTVYPDSMVYDFDILPESGSFEGSEYNRINEVLEQGELGVLTNLSYDDIVPGALDATIRIGSSEDNGDSFIPNYGTGQNYILSYAA